MTISYVGVFAAGRATHHVAVTGQRRPAPTPFHIATRLAGQDTRAGAIAALAANLAHAQTSCVPGRPCPHPYSLAPQGGGTWALGYRFLTYTRTTARFLVWGLSITTGSAGVTVNGSRPSSLLAWATTTVNLRWTGSRWASYGSTTESPYGPTPPPDGTTGMLSADFQRQIGAYSRFPTAP